jgi:hypothetical protein
MTLAQVFATFSLLPHARALFYLALLSYTVTSLMLVITVAQNYLNGVATDFETGFALFMLGWGLVFAGNSISQVGIFGRLYNALDKYRGPALPTFRSVDCCFLIARSIVLAAAFVVAVSILAGTFKEAIQDVLEFWTIPPDA